MKSPRQSSLPAWLHRHALVSLLAVCYLVAAIGLAFRMAPFAAPNEGLHYEYVALLRDTGKLPPPSVVSDERHQPPVYYAVAALVSRLVDNQQKPEYEINPYMASTPRGNHNPAIHPSRMIYAARLASVGFGLLGVLGMYMAALHLFGFGNTAAAASVAALLAFQPNYLYLGAAVGNDVPVAALCAWLLAASLALILQGGSARRYLALGLLFGMCMLTKANAVVMGIALPAVWLAEQRRIGWLAALRCALYSLAGFCLLYLPWVIFNELRGDTLGISKSVPLKRALLNNPLNYGLIEPYLSRIFHSVWLDWSPGEIGYAQPRLYILTGGVLLFALAGWAVHRRTVSASPSPAAPFSARSTRVIAAGLCMLPVLMLIWLYIATKSLAIQETNVFVPEGRWMLPVFSVLALLIGGGWWRWWPPPRKPFMAALLALVMMATTVSQLIVHLPEVQPQVRMISVDQIPTTAQKPALTYGEDLAIQTIQLLAIESPFATVGQRLDVPTYWQALKTPMHDYAVVAELVVPVGNTWQVLAHITTFPGYGTAPTKDWPVGPVIADVLTFFPTTTVALNGPVRAQIVIHLVQPATPATTQPVFHEGRLMTTSPIAQEITLRPVQPLTAPAPDALTAPAQFGAGIQLVSLSTRWANGKLHLTLWWQAVADVSTSLTLFTHVLNADGKLLAQSDGVPNAGLSPTQFWRKGDVIRDEREIAVPQQPGLSLALGFYDSATKERVAAMQDSKPLQDNMLRLLQ